MTGPADDWAHRADRPARPVGGPSHRTADPTNRTGGPSRPSEGPVHRIEDLAHFSGATVRTIRAYQDRGLLPPPQRRGRANVYADVHLARLRQIADLLDRGYTLASIKELLEAWDAGRGLGAVLGLVAEVDDPRTDEEAVRISRAELNERFGGAPNDEAVAEAVRLGVLEPAPGDDDVYLVPSPQGLALAAELHAAGVPLSDVLGNLRELRAAVDHITSRFLEFTTEHVVPCRLDGPHGPTDAETAAAASLIRRLRPLAEQTVDAELARVIRLFAVRPPRLHLGSEEAPPPGDRKRCVAMPAETMRAVEGLVGAERASEFIALAAEREVRARALDRLATSHGTPVDLDEEA